MVDRIVEAGPASLTEIQQAIHIATILVTALLRNAKHVADHNRWKWQAETLNKINLIMHAGFSYELFDDLFDSRHQPLEKSWRKGQVDKPSHTRVIRWINV